MKKLALACLAAVAMAQTATATSGGCVSLADPAGDERFVPIGAPTSGATDLLSTDVVASGADVTAVFRLSAAPDPLPGTRYMYGVTFEDADTVYELHAGLGLGRNPLYGVYELFSTPKSPPPPDPGGAAGVPVGASTGYRTDVTGSVDLVNGTVTVTAPAAAFGVAELTQGRTWTVVEARTKRGASTVSFGPIDSTPAAGAPLVAGDGTCA